MANPLGGIIDLTTEIEGVVKTLRRGVLQGPRPRGRARGQDPARGQEPAQARRLDHEAGGGVAAARPRRQVSPCP